MKRLALTFGLALPIMMAAADARAFFSERYLVCKEEKRASSSEGDQPSTPRTRTRLAKRRAPEPLEVGKLVIADLVTPEVVSFGKAEEEIPPLGPVIARESTNDFRCLGLVRGRAGILRVISAPPRARFRGHPYPESWIEENMHAAARFHLEETVPFLDRLLHRKVPRTIEDHVAFERARLKVAAATALADFGHRAAAPEIVSFLRERESSSFPGLWEEALEALSRLDPDLGHAYAVELLGRIGERTLETREENQIRSVLPLLVRRDPEALSRLERIHRKVDPTENGTNHLSCLLFAARMRAGDDGMKSGFRKELAESLVTNRSSVCYSQAMEVAYPGEDPSEVDTLLFRHRYEELIRLVASMARGNSTGEKPNPRFEAARVKIRAWLRDRLTEPEIGSDAGDRRFQPDDRARHHALAAALGDTTLAKELEAIILDPKDEGTAPWIGAAAALDLDLPRAADLAGKRLLLALEKTTQSYRRDPWRRRGKLTITEHGEIVLRLFGRGDPRFVLGLLDRDIHTRELTTHLVARKPPSEALCRLVTENATLAEAKSVEDAFWALSVHGDTCRASFEQAFAGVNRAPEVGGMALEALAMLRAPKLPLSKRRGDSIDMARARARIIVGSPE